MMSKLRILVADRQRSTRSALGMLLAAQPDLELAGEAADLVELLGQVKAHDPDLVVLDWEMLEQRIELLLDLLGLFERPPAIVALSVRAENETAARGARPGPPKPGSASTPHGARPCRGPRTPPSARSRTRAPARGLERPCARRSAPCAC